ncbi:CHAT domain-containing protein [bacterium]|nr:CHAT domain-containing protein [bacterium]
MQRPFRGVRLSAGALCLTICASLAGCGGRTEGPPPFFDLTGVPLSADLQPAAARAMSAWSEPAAGNRIPRDLDIYNDLALRIRRPASRQAAGDELYARWRDDPGNFLWIGLAARFNSLMHRYDERNAMYALPALADSTSPVGAYVRGRRFFRYGDEGDFYRQAERDTARLDGLQRVWLQRKLALVDSYDGNNLGAVRRLLGSLEQARVIGGSRLEYYLWFDIAEYLHKDDRLDDALHAAAVSGSLARKAGNRYLALKSRISLASILGARREYEAALEILRECLARAADADYPWLYSNSAYLSASLCGSLGDITQALAVDRMVLAYNLALGDSLNVPRCLVNVADDFRRLGRLDSCRVYMDRARVWVDRHHDKRNRAKLPGIEAEYHCQIGNYAVADSLLAEAREGVTTAGLALDEADLLLKLLRQGLETGQADVAYRTIARLEQLRDVLHDSDPGQNLLADYEIASADFLARQGEFRLAAEAVARAERAVEIGGGMEKRWSVLRSAGELALLRGDRGSAREAFLASLDLAERGGDPDLLARSRFHLGHVYLLANRYADARRLFAGRETDTAFGGRFRTRLSSRLFLGMTYSREGRQPEALAHFDAVRALTVDRSPGDLVARLDVESAISLTALGRAREAEQALLRVLSGLRRDGGQDQVAELRTFSGDPRRDALEGLVGLYHDDPQLLGDADPGRHTLLLVEETLRNAGRTIDGAELRARLDRLLSDDDSPLLAFLVGGARSFAWVAAGGEVELTALPGRRELDGLLAAPLCDMENPARPVESATVRALSRILLGPLGERWREGRTLRIVPDDLLFALPWAALPLPGQVGPGPDVLALDHGPLVEAPSLLAFDPDTIPSATHAGRERRPLLAIGLDADIESNRPAQDVVALRHAEEEVGRIAALWPAEGVELALGEDALWQRVAARGLDRFGVIHLATHAAASQGLPARSTLRFAGGGASSRLTIPEIGRLELDADLIYLSCCEASRKLSGTGRGLMDFAGAFLQAGARSVIASTLRVDDEASSHLACRFYHHWLDGKSKADALRAAQQDLRAADARWRHPYFWAFYRLIGCPD